MKSYTITVNGNVYDVTVEENGAVNCTDFGTRNVPSSSSSAAAPGSNTGRWQNVKIEAVQQEKYLRSSLLLAHL